MMVFAGAISDFIERHPDDQDARALVPDPDRRDARRRRDSGSTSSSGYIYFAMAFSLGVEMLNIRLRKKAEPVHLRQVAPMPEGE